MTIESVLTRARSTLAQPIGPPSTRLPGWLGRTPRSTALVAVALTVVALGVTWLVAQSPWSPGSAISDYRGDLDVYRLGSRLWLAGHNLYVPIHTAHAGTLPFLYPPLSAILFTPLAVQRFAPASVEITLLSTIALATVLVVALRTYYPRGLGRRHWLALGLLLPVALVFEPVRSTLGFGQVNLLLMALVVLDCLAARPKWPRGALIGLAAAVKLTPAAFVLFFLLRKDWRSALRAGISFLVCTGLGFALDWHDSVRYWTKVAYQTNRIGLGYVGNQSITAVLMRFGLHPPVRGAVYLVLVLMLLAVAVLAVRRALAGGHPLLALSLNGVLELLVSPISWSHHWVWSVPLVLSLFMLGRRRRAALPLVAGSAALVLFISAPQWNFADPRHWHFWQQLAGNCYVYFGVLMLLGAAFVPMFGRRAPTPVPTRELSTVAIG